jgi:hypothetical protein
MANHCQRHAVVEKVQSSSSGVPAVNIAHFSKMSDCQIRFSSTGSQAVGSHSLSYFGSIRRQFTMVGTEFRLTAYLRATRSRVPSITPRIARLFIRIKSAHKWPEPIVIDTSLPTIVPPLPVLAKAPIINQPRDALAQLKPPLSKASEYSVRAKLKVAAQVRPARIAAYRAIPEALPAGW